VIGGHRMTKQEQNDLILAHISDELRQQPDIQRRVGIAFNNWFQAQVALGMQTIPASQLEVSDDESAA